MSSDFERFVSSFYNSRADYDNLITISRAEKLVELYPPVLGGVAIDFATGTGNVACRLAREIGALGKVIGIDIAAELLTIAATKIKSLNITNLELQQLSVSEFNFPLTTYDCAYCSFAIVLFESVETFLKNVYQSVKPGGFFAFSCTSRNSYFSELIIEAGRIEDIEIPEIHRLLGNPNDIKSMLMRCDFSEMEIFPVQMGRNLSLQEAKSKWNGKFWLHPRNTLQDIPMDIGVRMKANFDRLVNEYSKDGEIWFEELVYYVKTEKSTLITSSNYPPLQEGFTDEFTS